MSDEIESRFVKDESDPKYYPNGSDVLYESAKALIIKTSTATAPFLQEYYNIGYARATRLLDLMEEEGIVGPPKGAKSRQVFIPAKVSSSYIK